jgi:hypothetical protein
MKLSPGWALINNQMAEAHFPAIPRIHFGAGSIRVKRRSGMISPTQVILIRRSDILIFCQRDIPQVFL